MRILNFKRKVMTMNELIEKLKSNKTPFGLLEAKEQKCLRKINRNGCMYYGSAGWEYKKADDTFTNWQTYAIKPDYQPEPKYRDRMSKKIWAICSGGDWYDASISYLILPDGMNIEAEHRERVRLLQEYHLAKRNGRDAEWPGSFTEHLISKGAIVPSEDVLEEYWDD